MEEKQHENLPKGMEYVKKINVIQIYPWKINQKCPNRTNFYRVHQ